MTDAPAFPHDVSTGMTGLFKVVAVSVGVYHVKQVQSDGQWVTLAISHHLEPAEAIGVMEEAQRYYHRELMKLWAASAGNLNAGVPNHHDHSQRGFVPK